MNENNESNRPKNPKLRWAQSILSHPKPVTWEQAARARSLIGQLSPMEKAFLEDDPSVQANLQRMNLLAASRRMKFWAAGLFLLAVACLLMAFFFYA